MSRVRRGVAGSHSMFGSVIRAFFSSSQQTNSYWTLPSLRGSILCGSFEMSCSQWRGERILGMTATSSPRSVVFLQPRQLRAAVQVITSLAVNYLRKLVLATANLRPLKCNPVSPSLFLRFCSREVGERYLFESNFHIRASRRHLPQVTNTKC